MTTKLEGTATIQDLRRKIRELQESHNRLTTIVGLQSIELQKLKAHTEYREPEQSPEDIQKRRQQVEQFRRGTPSSGGGGGGGRPLRTIDN